MIVFNLACYASVAGRMEEAKARLRLAIELDKGVRRLALDDEDLTPLWNWIGGFEWAGPSVRKSYPEEFKEFEIFFASPNESLVYAY
jgi:hypothetical protein